MLSARTLLGSARGRGGSDAAPTVGENTAWLDVARQAAVILALLVPMKWSPAAVSVALVLLVLAALHSPRLAIQAIALSAVVRFLNPALVQQDLAAGPLGWLVLIAAGVRVIPLIRVGDARELAWLWLFAAAAATLSATSSPWVAVSLTKVVMFAWASTTVIAACRLLNRRDVARLETWFVALAAVVLALTLLTLPFPAIAYFSNGTGLQGITRHPQTLAIVLVPFAAFLMTDVILRRRLPPLPMLALAASGWWVLFQTEARTGVVAAVTGVLAGLLMHFGRRAGGQWLVSRSRTVGWLLAIMLLVPLLAYDRLATSVEVFLFKRSGESELGDAFYQSRGAGIAGQWRNFIERPLAGHGFGVPGPGLPAPDVVEFAGVPISAPVEKGFLPTATLEETGVIGGLLLGFALLQLGRRAWRAGDPRWFAVLAGCVATNVGEATLLSPGGPGLLLWCVIGLAAHAQRQHIATQAPPAAHATSVVLFPNLLR
jgi:hypothetical protein